MAISSINPSKLKIGIVFDDSLDKPDGVQQYILNIGHWLSSQGHDVHYLVGETKRTDLKNLHSLSRNLKVKFNGNRMSIPLPSSSTKLKKFLDQQQFDILHVQLPYSPFLAHRIIMAAGKQVAIIGTFHIFAEGWAANIGTKLLRIWLHKSIKRFDRIVSVSQAAAAFASKSFRIETDVLPNVIDFDRFALATPLEKYDDQILNILFLGRLVPRKGCQVLLEAVNLIKIDSTLPKFRVIICGKGPLATKLSNYVTNNGLTNLVEFVGFVSEESKPSYYTSADISVFPSSGGESFGIVLLEAMASGQAEVLAGDNPGYRSVMSVKPEQLFNPFDVNGLAVRLRNSLLDVDSRNRSKQWGQAYSKTFDTKLIGRKILDIYQEALRNRFGK